MNLYKNNEKELLRNIYDNFIDMINFNDTFENDLIEWIKDTLAQNNKSEKIILEFMQDHSKSDSYFPIMIGLFYHHGIGTNIDSDKAVNSYLTAIKNEDEI